MRIHFLFTFTALLFFSVSYASSDFTIATEEDMQATSPLVKRLLYDSSAQTKQQLKGGCHRINNPDDQENNCCNSRCQLYVTLGTFSLLLAAGGAVLFGLQESVHTQSSPTCQPSWEPCLNKSVAIPPYMCWDSEFVDSQNKNVTIRQSCLCPVFMDNSAQLYSYVRSIYPHTTNLCIRPNMKVCTKFNNCVPFAAKATYKKNALKRFKKKKSLIQQPSRK